MPVERISQRGYPRITSMYRFAFLAAAFKAIRVVKDVLTEEPVE
jgi:hypothetical protein